MYVRFKWRAEADFFMNIVSMTGVMKGPNDEIISSRLLLLRNAMEMIQVAEYFDGIVIPSKPPQKNEACVYFQVMFRDYTDCTDFLRAITNESS